MNNPQNALTPEIIKSRFRVTDDEFTELVKKYCRDLTQRVNDGKTGPIVGRDDEVQQMTTVLLQKGRSNACLLGGAGVGKTAAFIALARHLVLDDNVPKYFTNARVLEIDFSMVGAGAESKGELLARLLPLVEGASERNESGLYPVIIFCIDELHACFMSSMSAGASATAGVGDIMKPYLTTGNLRIVGATTTDEFNLYIKTDPALERRFQKVLLEEPSDAETIAVLKGIKPGFEKHFDIEIPDESLPKIVDLGRQFMRNRNNPDKSIMIMDGACARSVKAGSDRITLDAITETVAAETGLDAKALR